MALAFDASSEGTYSTGSSFSWTHTPVGTPKGVFIGIVEFGTNADDIVSVTYGGVTATRISILNGGNSTAFGYYLGAGLPTGAQTVTVNTSASPSGNIWASSVTITAGVGKDTQLAGTGSGTASGNNPSVTITTISGASYGFGVMSSSLISESATAGTGQTMRQSFDEGSKTGYVESSTSPTASGNITIAFTATATNELVAIAVEEFTPPSGPTNLKTYNTNAKANIKTMNTNPIANVKTFDTNA